MSVPGRYGYAFLSQIFNCGNTAIEKRAIFYKRLLPLLEFGREREGIDLSKVVLTHHNLKNLGKRAMPLSEGKTPKLEPITEAGSGSVQEKEKALLNEIIEKVNDLFEGDLTDQDKLVYVNNVIKGKLLESETLRQQATNNTKERAANYAAKLTAISLNHATWITPAIYNNMNDSVKYGPNKENMWEKRTWTTMNKMEIWGSTWRWGSV